jgi:hypothetical protein
MRRVAFACLVLFGGSPAFAQYAPPRPPATIGPMAAADVADIVQAMGLDPIGPPAQSGAFYLQRAADDHGRVLRVTVDARRSQVVAIEPAHRPYGHQAYGQPHQQLYQQSYQHPWGLPGAPYRRRYPGYAAAAPDHDDLAPPGSIMARRDPYGQPARLQPPQTATPYQIQPPRIQQSRPVTRSAAVPPPRSPMPRRRPAAPPEQAAAGSVDPVSPPTSTSASPPSPPPASKPADAKAPDAKPAEPALTPVAPLE